MKNQYRENKTNGDSWRENSIIEYSYLVKHIAARFAMRLPSSVFFDELRSMDPYSRSMRKKIQNIAKAVKIIEDQKGSPAADEEICEELGVSLEAYYDMLTNIHGASVLSLDEFIKTKKNDTYSGTRFQSGIKGDQNPADCFDKKELKFVLAQIIKTLTQKEQIVVSLYYYDELTLKEIGEVLSLTESRICQIHTAVLVRLKVKLQDYFN